MKKRLGIIAGILGIVLAVIGIVLKQKLNCDNFIFMIVVGIILLILAGVIFYKRKH